MFWTRDLAGFTQILVILKSTTLTTMRENAYQRSSFQYHTSIFEGQR